MPNIAANSESTVIFYSKSYSIQYTDGWDDDKEQLVQLKDLSAESMELRAQGSDLWPDKGLYNSTDSKLVANRLSKSFTLLQ